MTLRRPEFEANEKYLQISPTPEGKPFNILNRKLSQQTAVYKPVDLQTSTVYTKINIWFVS